MKQTRMRMTKDAAAIIHDYRDKHGIKSNAEAIHGMASNLDVANCNEVYVSKQLSHLQNENDSLGRCYRTMRSYLAMKTEELGQTEASLKIFKDSLAHERELVKTLREDRRWGLDQISALEKQIERIESFRAMWKGVATAGWTTLLMVCVGLLAHMIITP